MSQDKLTFTIYGLKVEARHGQTILEACDAAGIYIPRLCYHPDLEPAGHCRVCTYNIDGRRASACTMVAVAGMVIESDTPEVNEDRRTLIEMMFVEGNHICPSCEKSGDCELQALGYRLGMEAPQTPYLWPERKIDATHPDIFIDRNHCILCSLCIRASKTEDGKTVFGFEGRGIHTLLSIGIAGRLDDTALKAADKGAHVCPVGCIFIKRTGYQVPEGNRKYDQNPIGSEIEARRVK